MMRKLPPFLSGLPIAFCALILILAYGLWLRADVLLGGAAMQAQTLPDDAFFYFRIAEQIVAGHGSTFDGLYRTNGYHPLWLALLLPPAAVVTDPVLLVRCALALSITLNIVTTGLLYLLVRRATTVWWIPPLAAAIYFWNYRVVASSVNGLETALSTTLYALTAWVLLTHLRQGKVSLWLVSAFGTLLGLLFLARTDNIFAVLAFSLVAVCWMPPGQRWARAAILGGSALTVAAPWLLWNSLVFGSPIQTSGLAFPYVLHESYRLADHSAAEMRQHSLDFLFSFLRSGLFTTLGFSRVLSLAGGLFTVAVYGVLRRRPLGAGNSFARQALGLGLVLAAADLPLIVVHTAIRWYSRTWYFDSLILLAIWLVALSLGQALEWLGGAHKPGSALARVVPGALVRWGLPTLVGLALVLAVARGVGRLTQPLYGHQLEMLAAAGWLQSHLAPGESAAAFNPGIMALFSGHTVTDLDGVINDAAYQAIRARQLGQLLRESRASYYLDFDPLMLNQFQPFLGDMSKLQMIPVYEVPRPDSYTVNSQVADSPIRIYRLVWQP